MKGGREVKPQSFVTFCLSRSLLPPQLRGVPLHCLRGLGGIYSQLETLTCSRSIQALEVRGGEGSQGPRRPSSAGLSSLQPSLLPASLRTVSLPPLLYFRSAVYLSVCLWSHLPSCIQYSHVHLPILPTTDSWGQGPGLVFSLSLQTKFSI